MSRSDPVPTQSIDYRTPSAAKLSAARGMDPDAPRHLSKVTKTN